MHPVDFHHKGMVGQADTGLGEFPAKGEFPAFQGFQMEKRAAHQILLVQPLRAVKAPARYVAAMDNIRPVGQRVDRGHGFDGFKVLGGAKGRDAAFQITIVPMESHGPSYPTERLSASTGDFFFPRPVRKKNSRTERILKISLAMPPMENAMQLYTSHAGETPSSCTQRILRG